MLEINHNKIGQFHERKEMDMQNFKFDENEELNQRNNLQNELQKTQGDDYPNNNYKSDLIMGDLMEIDKVISQCNKNKSVFLTTNKANIEIIPNKPKKHDTLENSEESC